MNETNLDILWTTGYNFTKILRFIAFQEEMAIYEAKNDT